MWKFITLLLLTLFASTNSSSNESEDPVLYYYGLEESERSLPRCSLRQACSAFIQRYWRPPALVRLCRCERRSKCDVPAAPSYRMPINNHAYFQFCHPIAGWPQCDIGDTPVTVETAYERMNPDELEELHHNNTPLTPPTVIFHCRCHEPNYWKPNVTADSETTQAYKCSSLPPCKTDEHCGNVSHDLNALYQSCLCPKHNICVHDGGVTHLRISELLYRGKGWKAYCRRTADFSYEDYY